MCTCAYMHVHLHMHDGHAWLQTDFMLTNTINIYNFFAQKTLFKQLHFFCSKRICKNMCNCFVDGERAVNSVSRSSVQSGRLY